MHRRARDSGPAVKPHVAALLFVVLLLFHSPLNLECRSFDLVTSLLVLTGTLRSSMQFWGLCHRNSCVPMCQTAFNTQVKRDNIRVSGFFAIRALATPESKSGSVLSEILAFGNCQMDVSAPKYSSSNASPIPTT